MRKLLIFCIVSFLAKIGLAAGNVNPVTVSTGVVIAIDAYTNANGNTRQAVVFGDFTSSDTVRVDQITGMRVSLSTSALTTTDGVKVVSGATNLVITSTATLPVNPFSIATVGDGLKLIPTFHPSYLLRNPSAKKEAWDDLKKVMAELGLKSGKSNGI